MKNFQVRPYFSFSQMSSFKYNKKRFLENYYYGKFDKNNPFLILGKKMGKALQFRNTKENKEIEQIRTQIPPSPIYEKELKANLGKISLLGFADGWFPKKDILIEHKTGQKASEFSWKQQMLFYSLLLWLSEKKIPKKIKLYWMPTIFNENEQLILTGKVKEYEFRITLEEIILFSAEVKKTYKEIEELCQREYEMFGPPPYKK